MTIARRGAAATGLARPGGPDQRGGCAGRVPVRLRGTDRQELAGPLLAGRPGCRPGTYTGATARPRRDPKVSANSPMTIKARARSLPGRKRNSTRTAPWRWGGLNLSMPGGKLTGPLVT